MSAKKIAENTKGTSKETKFKEIALQLTQALQSLKESLGEKKFEKRIKKAAKILGEGIKSKGPEKMPIAKSAAAKTKLPKVKVASPVKKSPRTSPAK